MPRFRNRRIPNGTYVAVVVCYANCSKDEGRPLGRDLSGESAKRPLAAVHKRHGGERKEEKAGRNQSRKSQEDERKRTADDVSIT